PGRRRMGAGAGRAAGRRGRLLPARQWLCDVLAAHAPTVDVVAVETDRLAPRYRFPTAADDVRAGWDWLLTGAGLAPERLVVVGDSAGGYLAVDLLLQPDVTAAQPAALVLFSPLVDLTFRLAARCEQRRRDPAIRVSDAARLVGLYTRGVDPAHP